MFFTDWFIKNNKEENIENNIFQEREIKAKDLLKDIPKIELSSETIPHNEEDGTEALLEETTPHVSENAEEQSENLTENKMSENQENKIVENLLEKVLSGLAGLTQKKQEDVEMISKAEFETVSAELASVKSELETIKSEKEIAISEIQAKLDALQAEKDRAEEAERIAKEEARKAELLAEAKDYPGLVGTLEQIVAKLEKINAIEDEELRNEIKENLKKKSSENMALTEELGCEAGEDINPEEKAEKELYAKAEKLAEEKGITVQQAIYRIKNNIV